MIVWFILILQDLMSTWWRFVYP